MDPVHIAFRHHHHDASTDVGGELGVCCRCGTHDAVVPLNVVVSAKFTGFDALHRGDGLCGPCRWAFAKQHFTTVWKITRHSAVALQPTQLHEELLRPMRADALVVPLGGRKHLLPHAQWGTVHTDDLNLHWRAPDAQRLSHLTWLRRHRCPTSSIPDPVPSWRWLATQPPNRGTRSISAGTCSSPGETTPSTCGWRSR